MTVATATGRSTRRSRQTPIERFADKCRHDPVTGCVIWSGGTSSGVGGAYGAFWFEGKRWAAHRWAAKYIHGLEIDGDQVYQTCDNPLCQEHVAVGAIGSEDEFRYNWVLISVGERELPPKKERNELDIPFHLPPEWLQPFITKETQADDCPF